MTRLEWINGLAVGYDHFWIAEAHWYKFKIFVHKFESKQSLIFGVKIALNMEMCFFREIDRGHIVKCKQITNFTRFSENLGV